MDIDKIPSLEEIARLLREPRLPFRGNDELRKTLKNTVLVCTYYGASLGSIAEDEDSREWITARLLAYYMIKSGLTYSEILGTSEGLPSAIIWEHLDIQGMEQSFIESKGRGFK